MLDLLCALHSFFEFCRHISTIVIRISIYKQVAVLRSTDYNDFLFFYCRDDFLRDVVCFGEITESRKNLQEKSCPWRKVAVVVHVQVVVVVV